MIHGNLLHDVAAVPNQISVCRGGSNEDLFKLADENLGNNLMPSALLSLNFSSSYSKYPLSNAYFIMLSLGAKLRSNLMLEEERNVGRTYMEIIATI